MELAYRRNSVHPVPYRSSDSVIVQRSDPHSGSGRYKINFNK